MRVSSRNKKGTFVVRRNRVNEAKRHIEYAKNYKLIYEKQKGGK